MLRRISYRRYTGRSALVEQSRRVNRVSCRVRFRSRSRKSELLAQHERFRRELKEKLQTYVMRYVRVKRAYKEVSVNYAKILGPETRGPRLLEKAVLGEDQYRLIVVESSSLEFGDIVRAIQVLYPDRACPPPLVWPTRQREYAQDADQRNSSSRSSTS